ncbi:MAG: hypothetical protein JXA20_17745 [Spirochaetes bacterium]|nr:hypothetical protein [Spirochaetota bacterium]
MKKIVLLCVTVFILLASLSMARAVTLSVGGNLWYNWWIPAFKEGKLESMVYAPSVPYLAYRFSDSRDIGSTSTVTGGPALSVRIDRFSLSTVLVYANYRVRNNGLTRSRNYILYPALPASAAAAYVESYLSIRRWDSDTTLSYSLTPVMSLLLGLKVQSYSLKSRTADLVSGIVKASDDFITVGPGLGLGLTIPLVSDLFLICNTTVFLLWSRQEASKNIMVPSGVVIYFDDGSYFGLGTTVMVAGAYVLSSVNTTLALGLRYQLLWYRSLDDRSGTVNVDRKMDHNCGITLSAIYTFDFSNDD